MIIYCFTVDDVEDVIITDDDDDETEVSINFASNSPGEVGVTSTVEPRISGPRLSGLFDYPDFFSGPVFFMNINKL